MRLAGRLVGSCDFTFVTVLPFLNSLDFACVLKLRRNRNSDKNVYG